jgi:hypothetical protein
MPPESGHIRSFGSVAIEKQCKEQPKAMFVIALHEALRSLYKDNRTEVAPEELT